MITVIDYQIKIYKMTWMNGLNSSFITSQEQKIHPLISRDDVLFVFKWRTVSQASSHSSCLFTLWRKAHKLHCNSGPQMCRVERWRCLLNSSTMTSHRADRNDTPEYKALHTCNRNRHNYTFYTHYSFEL